MLPYHTTAAILVLSEDDVMPSNACAEPMLVSSVQVEPELEDTQMLPLCTPAAILVPSEDDVMENQSCFKPTLVFVAFALPKHRQPEHKQKAPPTEHRPTQRRKE